MLHLKKVDFKLFSFSHRDNLPASCSSHQLLHRHTKKIAHFFARTFPNLFPHKIVYLCTIFYILNLKDTLCNVFIIVIFQIFGRCTYIFLFLFYEYVCITSASIKNSGSTAKKKKNVPISINYFRS